MNSVSRTADNSPQRMPTARWSCSHGAACLEMSNEVAHDRQVVRPANSPNLKCGLFDIELEAEESRPLPSGVPQHLFVLVADIRKPQPAGVNDRDLPAGFVGMHVRPVGRVHRRGADDRIVEVVDADDISAEVLQRITYIPRELPDQIRLAR